MSEAVKVSRSRVSETSLKVLCKQYLHKGEKYKVCSSCGQRHETLDELFDRVSFGITEYRDIISRFDFLPNSPTIFNAGGEGVLSACFKFDVEDTLESICYVDTKASMVQKWGGGVGFCLSQVRAKGMPIRSTHGGACGPVAVMHKYHASADLITQGGKREGALMAILHCDHADIEEFIHCKSQEGVLRFFNISVAVTDEFMSKVDSTRKKLFSDIVHGAWTNGDPGLFFIDTAERGNLTPHLGKLTGTNPCGEVPLLNNEACNLGSINLRNHIEGDHFNFAKLTLTAFLATKYLDGVIDQNFYVVPEIEEATLKTRKIGLGVMGWADALALLKIPYDSQEACDLAEEVMKTIHVAGHKASDELLKEKGPCPALPDKRNVCVTCIAPAGSISTIANCSSGIEPHYSLDYYQVMGDGTKLRRTMDFGDFTPRTASDIGWEWHVRHQAAFQKYTDLAVSKTINMPNSATEEDVRNAYILAWKLGCKGTTVYRDGSRVVQALYKSDKEMYSTDSKLGTQRYKMNKTANALRHGFSIGGMKGYLHVGFLPNNTLGEIFITGANQGSTVSGLLSSLSIVTSLALQHGVPLELLVSKLQNVRFEPAGPTGNPDIPIAPSIVAYIYRFLGKQFLNDCKVEEIYTGMLCPDCGASAISREGCMQCSQGCGWSLCG